jgi:hypothetical protein
MAILFNGVWGTQQTNAASVTLAVTAPSIHDCLISWCLTNNGLPSVNDNLGTGTWSTPILVAGPTGGARNYATYMAYLVNCPSATNRSITWTGGASGQITALGCHIGGLALVTPYDTNAIGPGGGNSTTLSSSNSSNSTTYANEIIFGIGSVDTSSTVTWTYGNVAGVAATTTSMTAGGSGSAPNVLAEYNIVSAQGVYNATASSNISGHWSMALCAFADTNVSPNATYTPFTQTQFFQVDNVSHF